MQRTAVSLATEWTRSNIGLFIILTQYGLFWAMDRVNWFQYLDFSGKWFVDRMYSQQKLN